MYVRADSGSLESRAAYEQHVRRQNSSTVQPINDISSQPDTPPQQQQQSAGLTPWSITIIIAIIVVVLIASIITTYSYLRKLRFRGKQPKYLPPFLKKKWNTWKPKGKYSSLDDQDVNSVNGPSEQVIEISAGVNRHTSVRSVITLPSYSRTPNEHEEILGREGERAGMDTVVEFPETVDEEEARREEEMESLFQIRQARRQEIAEREERRRQRREAREAGDFARLEELRRDSRQRRDQQNPLNPANIPDPTTAEMLIAEHNARGRDRRVSSVSYAALGQVRHDGSRIRAESKESERGGLLDRAAPMGSVPPLPHSRNGSDVMSLVATSEHPRSANRDRSNSRAVSVSSMGSSFDNISRNEIRPTTSGTSANSQPTHQTSDSSSEEVDIVEERVEPVPVAPGSSPMPPQYEAIEWGDAPAYTEEERVARMNSINSVRAQDRSRAEGLHRLPSRAPQLPSLHATPTFRIESPTTPSSPTMRQ